MERTVSRVSTAMVVETRDHLLKSTTSHRLGAQRSYEKADRTATCTRQYTTKGKATTLVSRCYLSDILPHLIITHRFRRDLNASPPFRLQWRQASLQKRCVNASPCFDTPCPGLQSSGSCSLLLLSAQLFQSSLLSRDRRGFGCSCFRLGLFYLQSEM